MLVAEVVKLAAVGVVLAVAVVSVVVEKMPLLHCAPWCAAVLCS